MRVTYSPTPPRREVWAELVRVTETGKALRDQRDALVLEARDLGVADTDLAALLGVHRNTIHQHYGPRDHPLTNVVPLPRTSAP